MSLNVDKNRLTNKKGHSLKLCFRFRHEKLMNKKFSRIQKVSQMGTVLWTRRKGELVGCDQFGNQYYSERGSSSGEKPRRWVIYPGKTDATKIPPEWHCWLHYIFDKPIDSNSQLHHPWMKPHKANQTGTLAAYFPPGHTLRKEAGGAHIVWTSDDVV